MLRYMLLEFFDRHPVDPWTPVVSHHGPERLNSVFPFNGLFHQLLVHRFLSVVTRRLSLGMPSVRLRWLHHRAFLRRWIVIAVIASSRLACLYGLSFASFFFSSALWFFGPSLLAPFRAFLRYYGLC